MLLVLLTAASSHKLQDARRWFARGREAMAKCHPQRGAGDAFFNCTDPKTQPEFLYRRGSLVRLSENCLAADSTEIKLVSFVAGRVTDKSDGADLAEPGEMLGFGFGCDF